MLGEHVAADHPPRLADVELRRPVAAVAIFVLRQPPLLHAGADVGRHAVVVGEEPEHALLIPLVVGDDLPPPLVRRLRVIVVGPDVVERHGPVVVGVGLAIRDRVELFEHVPPAGREHAGEQLVAGRVVARRLGERDAVVGLICEAHAEAVGLHPLVAIAPRAGRVGRDQRQEAAPRISRRLERVHRHGEEVLVVEDAHLIAVPFLAIDGVRLAAHVIPHTRGGHEVAFVGRIDEHLAREPSARNVWTGERGDRFDPGARGAVGRRHELDAPLAVEPRLADDLDPVLSEPVLEDPLGHVRLEEPHRIVDRVGFLHTLPENPKRVARLPLPGLGPLVVLPDATIKLPREPPDRAALATVGVAEAAAREPAETLVGRDDHDIGPEHRGPERGDHRAARATVDDDVERLVGRPLRRRGRRAPAVARDQQAAEDRVDR